MSPVVVIDILYFMALAEHPVGQKVIVAGAPVTVPDSGVKVTPKFPWETTPAGNLYVLTFAVGQVGAE